MRVRIANDEYKCRMVYAKVHVHHDQGVLFTGFRQSADLWDSLFDCREIAWNMAKLMRIVLLTVALLWILVLEITECLIIFLRTTTTASYTEQTRHWISWCWDGSVVWRARCGKDSGVCGAETSGRLPCVILISDGASDDQYSRVRWVACAGCLYSLVYLHFFAWFVLHSSQEYLYPVMFWCKPESGV